LTSRRPLYADEDLVETNVRSYNDPMTSCRSETNGLPSEESAALGTDVLQILKGVLLFDPESCDEALEVLRFLSSQDYPVSVAYVEGYHDAVLESSGTRLVGSVAIRDFLTAANS